MDLKEVTERQDREAAARAALLETLPEDVQAALNQLPDAGRDYLLRKVRDLQDPDLSLSRLLYSGFFLGAVSYAFALGQLDNAGHKCLFDFEQVLVGATA